MLKSGAGLFFSALIMSSSSTELLKERHTKLCPTRDEMWGQLPRVQNADRKNAVNPSFSHCQHKHLTDAFLLPIHCIYHSAWKLPLFFFPQPDYFTAGSLFPSLSLCTFLKACARTAEVPFQQPAVKYSPVKPQSWRSGHPKLHWVQPTSLNLQEKKNKTSKDHTNEIYDKLPWKCQSKVISEILMFTLLAASWKLPSKTKRTAPQNLPSCPQFTWPQIQVFMVSPDLKISF